MTSALQIILLLLAAAVLVVTLFRSFNLPPVLGYLMVGVAIGPHALDLVPDPALAGHLAEFGVVFLMFSIGLEFSLPRLYSMRRIVFGLGLAQVLATLAVVMGGAVLLGLGWGTGFALGGVLAMSSTAVLSRLLAERLELDSRHGREVIGVLLFQDIAVVPLLIMVPALSQPAGLMAETVGLALLKAALVLVVVIFLGQRLTRGWFFLVARRKSSELFVLNVLLFTLGLAWLTELAGLSLALGAFVAGMLIAETEYRYQVEEDIKPFRDVLMGLFFITIGMFLDLAAVLAHLPWVLGSLVLLLGGKLVLVGGLSRLFGTTPGSALRSGLWLCAGGEFGFVLLVQARGLLSPQVEQVVLTTLVLSLMLAPLLVHFSDRIVLRFVASEWLLRSMQLTQIAARSMGAEKHVILCGYGRTGQHLARILEPEGFSLMALDLDPERVREAAAAGEPVSYGDCTRRETLVAAGIVRAHVLVITFADRAAALRVLHHVRALRPDLPVVVRAAEEQDVERLTEAGATEVIPEALESSVMLATHALALLGVPMSKVLRRLRELREHHYGLLRGFFHGVGDSSDAEDEAGLPRLHAVTLGEGAHAIGLTLDQLALDECGCTVSAIRRRGQGRARNDMTAAPLTADDVVVLLGTQAALAAGEELLLRGAQE
ncbi:monovalent cation:proton antiporter-2 (CPA2) family protein [Denitratisoma oestradiolicum]|uniref:Putative K(+) efflux antiporter KefB n=1 Tax=Denitratisoma oestradiolicum TaxID=311182 RepID=A0A6S6XVE8_9PROT|nr:monovalent cation:proton antiporter-2 (CPA2) family protein [Denitratisoma oestradiolicum]TWO79089.1 potassium transporter [Denitratisoma oestradiolicum]CAB1369919.1 putative K(+) efflux antiporter KefB [Denitratisoma oestradiolicum]